MEDKKRFDHDTTEDNASPVELLFDGEKQDGGADEAPKKRSVDLLKIGLIVSAAGVGIFFLITLISLLIYGKAYYYDGYDFTKVFCTIDLILMISGAVCVAVNLILMKVKHKTIVKNVLILSITAILLAIVCSIVPITNAANTGSRSSRSSSYSGSNGSSYEMDHSTYCLLYMTVSNVRVTHSGNYAYVSGTIKNTGTYRIRYVKVRAACKNSAGSVVDTDWTYAVDSDWLEPGESKSFEMMVRDPNNNIRSATVTVVTN